MVIRESCSQPDESARVLTKKRTYLDKDKTDLRDLTDSTIAKPGSMTNEEFYSLNLIPDFL